MNAHLFIYKWKILVSLYKNIPKVIKYAIISEYSNSNLCCKYCLRHPSSKVFLMLLVFFQLVIFGHHYFVFYVEVVFSLNLPFLNLKLSNVLR